MTERSRSPIGFMSALRLYLAIALLSPIFVSPLLASHAKTPLETATYDLVGVAVDAAGDPLRDRTLHAVPAERTLGEHDPFAPWYLTREEKQAGRFGGELEPKADGSFRYVDLEPGEYRFYAVPKELCLPGVQIEALGPTVRVPGPEARLVFPIHEVELTVLDEHGHALPTLDEDDRCGVRMPFQDPRWIRMCELDPWGEAMLELGTPVRTRIEAHRVRWQVRPDRPYVVVVIHPDRPLSIEHIRSSPTPGLDSRRIFLEPAAPDATLTVGLRNATQDEEQIEVREVSTNALLQEIPITSRHETVGLPTGSYRLRVTRTPPRPWCDAGYSYDPSIFVPAEFVVDLAPGERLTRELKLEVGGGIELDYRVDPDTTPPEVALLAHDPPSHRLPIFSLMRGDYPGAGVAMIRAVGSHHYRRISFYWPGSFAPDPIRSFFPGRRSRCFEALRPDEYELRVIGPNAEAVDLRVRVERSRVSRVEVVANRAAAGGHLDHGR